MPESKQLKAAKNEQPMTVEEFAASWEVTVKTVGNWVEFVYQAFEVPLHAGGPFPSWAVDLLNLCAKHVSHKAALYHAETGERRRLKGSEFVEKMRFLRTQGHFQQFEKFRNFQNFQTTEPELSAEELEDEALGTLGAITRRGDTDLSTIKQTIEQREDAEIEELASFIEDTDTRKMAKLVRRLQTGKTSNASIGSAIDVSYKRISEG